MAQSRSKLRAFRPVVDHARLETRVVLSVATPAVHVAAVKNVFLRGNFNGNFRIVTGAAAGAATSSTTTLTGSGRLSTLGKVTGEGSVAGLKIGKTGGRVTGPIRLTGTDGTSTLTLNIRATNGVSRLNLEIASGTGKFAGLTGKGTGNIALLGNLTPKTTAGKFQLTSIDITARKA